MKVKDFIERLRRYNPEAEVLMNSSPHCPDSAYYEDEITIEEGKIDICNQFSAYDEKQGLIEDGWCTEEKWEEFRHAIGMHLE